MAKITLIQGPNLNMLGVREPELYGDATLKGLHNNMLSTATQLGHALTHFQSNNEGDLIDFIQNKSNLGDFIILNLGAYTHTSIALRDALMVHMIPFIEVHISNIYKREAFRHHSYFSDIAIGCITGLGIQGYFLALNYAHHFLTHHNS